MKSKQTNLVKFLTVCIVPAVASMTLQSARAASATWNGGAATFALNTAANWTGGAAPTGSGETATWNGTAVGNLTLTWTGGFGASPSGTTIDITTGQTSALNIISSSATAGGAGDTFALGNLTIASGAGAVTFGDGVGTDNFVFRNPGGVTTNTLTNNSANTVTFASNTNFNSGGGAGRTVNINGSGNWLLNSALQLGGAGVLNFVKDGAGTLTLTGTGGGNTYVITAGTLKIAGSGLLGAATYTPNLTNNAAFSYESAASQTVSGIISGSGTIAQSAGSLTLTGANTYGGATTVNGGTLTVGGTGSINSTAGVTVNGASAKYLHTSTTPSTKNIALTQGTVGGTGVISTVTVANGTGMIANGNGNSAALTIGTLTFNGAATLTVTDDGDNNTPGVIVSGALTTTPANGSVTINASNSFWNSGTTYALVNAGSFGGTVSDFTKGTIGGLTSRQSSSLVLNGTTVGLLIGGDSPKWTGLDSSDWVVGTTGANGNWKLINGNTKTDYLQSDVVLFNDSATNTTVTISAANVSPAVVNFDHSDKNYTLNGAFGIAAGSVNKNGSGNLTISTPNSYAGGTTITLGTITLSGAGTLGATNGALTIADGTLDLGGTTQTVGTVALTSQALVQNGTLVASGLSASNSGVNAEISSGLNLGSGNLSKSGGGMLTLSGPTTYSGTTTINGGILTLSGLSSLGTTSGVTLGGGSLDLGGMSLTMNVVTIGAADIFGGTITNGSITPTALNVTSTSGVATISANILGTTGVTVSGAAGTLSLTGANTFSGPLNLTGPATVRIDGGSNSGGGAITYNSFGTTFTLNSGSYSTSGITANSLSEFRSLTLNGGILESAGNLFADTLAISITFNGGTLRSTNAAGITLFDYDNQVQVNGLGATFDTTSGGITVGNNADMISGGVHVPTVNQPKITGTGSGTVTLLGGGTLVSGIANNGLLDIHDNSTWNLNGIASSLGGLTGNGTVTNSAGAGILTLNVTAGPFTYSGTIAGGANLSLVKQGTGTQTLLGNNAYQGNTTVAAGTLEVTNNSASTFADTSTVSIATGAVLNLPNAATDVVASLVLNGVAQASGVYDSSTPGGYITGAGKIQVAAAGYSSWATTNAGGQAANLDFDNDGVSNGVEYFMGQTGSTFTTNPSLASGTVTWPKDPAFLGSYVVQTSTNLTTWIPAVGVVDSGTSVSYTLPAGQGSIFVHLRVTPN